MKLQQRILVGMLTLALGLGGVCAETLTPPVESLNGLRPGTLTVPQVRERMNKAPDVTNDGGLLGMYGGAENSRLYGWFLVENPSYTVPDLAVETAKDSDRVDLVMAIGHDGLRTEKGVTCFMSAEEVTKAYGAPEFVFAVPMQGFLLRELYYPELGLSIDIAPIGPSADLQVVAIYVTYPEYMRRAIELRRQYIKDGVGKDITSTYNGSREA